MKHKLKTASAGEAVEFLTKGSAKTLSTLQQRMEEAAERLDFEQAARLRDRIAAIKRLSRAQKLLLIQSSQEYSASPYIGSE